MKRQKYKPKNPNEYRQLRKCHIHRCSDDGIVSYRKGIAGTEHSCIPHVHRTDAQVIQLQTTKFNVADLLDLALYHARG